MVMFRGVDIFDMVLVDVIYINKVWFVYIGILFGFFYLKVISCIMGDYLWVL